MIARDVVGTTTTPATRIHAIATPTATAIAAATMTATNRVAICPATGAATVTTARATSRTAVPTGTTGTSAPGAGSTAASIRTATSRSAASRARTAITAIATAPGGSRSSGIPLERTAATGIARGTPGTHPTTIATAGTTIATGMTGAEVGRPTRTTAGAAADRVTAIVTAEAGSWSRTRTIGSGRPVVRTGAARIAVAPATVSGTSGVDSSRTMTAIAARAAAGERIGTTEAGRRPPQPEGAGRLSRFWIPSGKPYRVVWSVGRIASAARPKSYQ